MRLLQAELDHVRVAAEGQEQDRLGPVGDLGLFAVLLPVGVGVEVEPPPAVEVGALHAQAAGQRPLQGAGAVDQGAEYPGTHLARLGQGHHPQGGLGDHAQRSLACHQQVHQLVAGGGEGGLAMPQAHRLAAPGDDHGVGQAVQDLAVANAKGRVVVAADGGADGTGSLALRLVGQPQPIGGQLLVQLPDGDAGLDGDRHVGRVDLQDPVHALGLDQDALLPGDHPAAHAGSPGKRHHGQLVLERHLDDLDHLFGVVRHDDDVRQVGHVVVARAPIAAVGHAMDRRVGGPVAENSFELCQRRRQLFLVCHPILQVCKWGKPTVVSRCYPPAYSSRSQMGQ